MGSPRKSHPCCVETVLDEDDNPQVKVLQQHSWLHHSLLLWRKCRGLFPPEIAMIHVEEIPKESVSIALFFLVY